MSVHDNFDLSGFLKSKKLLKENQESKEANKWDNQLEDEMKWELLLTAVKDPKDAEKYIELKWNNLPPEVQSNIDWNKESEGQELDEISFLGLDDAKNKLNNPLKYGEPDLKSFALHVLTQAEKSLKKGDIFDKMSFINKELPNWDKHNE